MSEGLVGQQLGGFRLIELLGAGAHGSVYRARQVRLDRDVAVKVLDPVVARDPEAARRFEREGRSAASLDHPNVVPVFEAGEQDGIVYLAMRLIDGTTLEHRLENGPVATVAEAVDLLRPVADGLSHAHDRGLVHRDVKPSNILIDDGGIWLADFGIAASIREMGTYTTGVLGTAEYMAPEQANAGEVDHRADVYGLGCVAHHVLEGAPPYPGTDLISTLMSHVNDPIPKTGDPARDAFYGRALAKDPSDRFESASDLISGLESLIDVPTEASTPPSQAGHSTRRRLLASAGAAFLICAALFVLFGRGGDVEQANPERADAISAADDSPPSTAGPETSSPLADEANDPRRDGAGELAAGGTVEVGTTRSLLSTNPHVDRFIEPFVTGHVLPPLMMVNDDWTFSPWLAAEEPQVLSDDPLVVRWKLRSDATWDDGSPVTSSDVSRTLDYLRDPDSGATGVLLYEGLQVDVVDQTTFDLVFDSPVGAHRALFSTLHPIIKAQAYDDHLAAGESAGTFLVDGIDFSAGPYQVSGFDPGTRITLVRNEAWWGDSAPLLDRITVRSYQSARAQLDALEVGELDVVHVEDARATDATRARSMPGVSVEVGVADQFLRLEMNNRSGPMSDPIVRRAVASAIDRALIAESAVTPITGETVEPLNSLVWATSQPENDRPFAGYVGDPALARGLLQEAGWELGDAGARFKAGQVLEVQLLYAEGSSLAEQTLVQSVVLQLLDVGIRVVAVTQDEDELFDARRIGDFDLVVALDVVAPDPIATVFRFSSQYCPTSFAGGCTGEIATNLTGLTDERVDELLASTDSESDDVKRRALFVAVDARLAELVPSLPLYELPTFVAHSDRLGGLAVGTHRGGPFAQLSAWGFLSAVDLE